METTNRLTSQTVKQNREHTSFHIDSYQPNLNKQIRAIDDEIRELHVVDKDSCVNWSVDCVASPVASLPTVSQNPKKNTFSREKN